MKIVLISLFIFLFAVGIRLWNLNMMGRWWDEQWYLQKGYFLIELTKKGDFSNKFWYTDATDHPPLSSYFYGLASYLDYIGYDTSGKDAFIPSAFKGHPEFHYDPTATRMVSVIVSSLSVLLLFLFGYRYFSLSIGITSAIILAMLPYFLGYSQLVTLESFIMLTFTAAVFAYFLFLETGQKRYFWITAVLSGLAVGAKQSSVIIFFLFPAVYYFWNKSVKKKKISYHHLLYIPILGFITFVILCPIPWIYFPQFWKYTSNLWFGGGLIPERLFGITMGARWFYYPVAVLVTTPVLILLLTALGLKVSYDKRKQWIYAGVIIWFFVPFLMMFFHHRQHMVRYIIQFYAPMALLAAIGLFRFSEVFKNKKWVFFALSGILTLYLFIILYKITPFYLDYYNELVGGTKTVYEKKLFFIGAFGEGMRGAGMYIASHAKTHAHIGMALNPETSLYTIPSLQYETFNPKKRYDYVVVNYFNVIRIGFNENQLQKDYKLVYAEKADGADLTHVYQHK